MHGAKQLRPYDFINRILVQLSDKFTFPQNFRPTVDSALPPSWGGKLMVVYVQTASVATIVCTNVSVFSFMGRRC
jgi:hypothetical protein